MIVVADTSPLPVSPRSARRARRRNAFVSALAALGLLAACGGRSSRTQHLSGGKGGVGGSEAGGGGTTPGSGGASSGSGGTPALGGSAGRAELGCPPIAPPSSLYGGPCPAGLPADGCAYTLQCQSGPREFSYECGAHSDGGRLDESWAVGGACDLPYDFCWDGEAQVRCSGGSWQLMGWGGDPPPDCPQTRPEEGSGCLLSRVSGPAVCGYPCPEGAGWSVATCWFLDPPRWIYDGACAGSCGAEERALVDYLAMHFACETDGDCRTAYSECSWFAEHCSGAIALGPSGDLSELASLDEALTDCASGAAGAWSCARCDEVPPAPRCRNGNCTLSE
jgi:hypothetical protein